MAQVPRTPDSVGLGLVLVLVLVQEPERPLVRSEVGQGQVPAWTQASSIRGDPVAGASQQETRELGDSAA